MSHPETRNLQNYDARFYTYIQEGSAQSARIVAAVLFDMLPCEIHEVLDVGCGAGAWLTAFKSRNCSVLGLDGAHVSREMLLIDAAEFREQDLAEAFDLGRRFDLAICLEVAEHLPGASARTLVGSLCRHADIVVFSAAPPGQGGALHVNEQPFAYWRDLFADHGYQMYDSLRTAVFHNHLVKHWYRYNAFVYVNRAVLPDVHKALAGNRIEPGEIPRDISPLAYRCRKQIIRLLPVSLVTRLADLKKQLFNLAPGG